MLEINHSGREPSIWLLQLLLLFALTNFYISLDDLEVHSRSQAYEKSKKKIPFFRKFKYQFG